MPDKIFKEETKKVGRAKQITNRQRKTYQTKIYAEGRVCAEDGCKTILSIHNKNAYCSSCKMRGLHLDLVPRKDSQPVKTIVSDGQELIVYGSYKQSSVPKIE